MSKNLKQPEIKTQYYSVKEVAGLVGYSQSHIRRLCREGRVIGVHQEGNQWFLDLTEKKKKQHRRH